MIDRLSHLQILQLNVGRNWEAHESALQLAFENNCHAVLIQEPWIFTDRSRRISKHHPSFHQLAPTEDWSARPRVLTYIRKHPHLKAELAPFGPSSRDILAVQINTPQKTAFLVNIYNAPRGAVDEGQGLESLMTQTTPSSPCLIAGDFNLQHPMWQSSARPSPRAEPFLSWAEAQDLALTLPPDSPTRGQNMIDLSWANSALLNLGISSEVTEDLPPLADHEPIITTIQWGMNNLPRDAPPFRWSTFNDNLFQETLQGEKGHVDKIASTLPPCPSPSQLDELALNITQAISTSLEASTKRVYPRPCGHKWWNQDCTRVVKTLRRVTRDPTSTAEDIGDAKQALRRVVRHSKRHFWRSKVEEFEEPKDIFNAVKWNRTEGALPISPLKEGDQLHSSTDDKANYLVRALLQKASCSEDVEVNLEPIDDPKLPFPAITEKEIHTAVAKPKNSTPGKDGISTSTLKKAWPSLGPAISTLYQHCLDQGWHPTPFRDASLVALPKPGKRDRSSPRAYRLISLLSVLGKGLERLIARRIAWIAIKHKVLHPQQFGALPLRSATDLAAALIHDVEEAWSRGLKASMLTLDVQGAFDAVLRGQLIRRLREQGWPINLIRWVASFTQGRTASLRLGNHTSRTFQVPAGLPQGSPISPILFMPFIEPIFKQGSFRTRRGRFGYADDICQLVASPSLEENCTVLQHCTEELRQWGARVGLTFDLNKTELQHFSRGTKHSNPTCSIHTLQGMHTVRPPPPGGATRWLGIWFDRRLSFSKHCRTLAAKARQTAAGIKSLANTVRGASTRLLRQATVACVISVLCYGAEAWWPGRHRPRNQTYISNRVDSALSCLDRVLREALRGTLPAYRTTPIPVLHRETAIPPMEIILDQKRAAARLRASRLDSRHPILRRSLRTQPSLLNTRLTRNHLPWLERTEQTDPLIYPPWQPENLSTFQNICSIRDKACADFQYWADSCPPLSMFLFTDGSRLNSSDTAAGAGWFGYWGIWKKESACGHLSLPQHEVFDAEATAATEGLKAALNSTQAPFTRNLYVLLDNQEVARQLQGFPRGSSQNTILAFQEAANAWPNRSPRCTAIPPGKVHVCWIPGHTGIGGNEIADEQAKRGARSTPQITPPLARYAWACRTMKEEFWRRFQSYWNKNAPQQYQDLSISLVKQPHELSLPRGILGRLLAARTGHGDFAEYHERFGHEDAKLECSCGNLKTPHHFYYCRKGRKASPHPWGNQQVDEILRTKSGTRNFHKWLQRSHFYHTVCPAH